MKGDRGYETGADVRGLAKNKNYKFASWRAAGHCTPWELRVIVNWAAQRRGNEILPTLEKGKARPGRTKGVSKAELVTGPRSSGSFHLVLA